jgi:tRNA (guanine-N7-)-methyltransferase
MSLGFTTRQLDPIALSDAPVDVELGCADARFLFELAKTDPVTQHIGLEIREPVVDEVNRVAARDAVPNVKAYFAQINVHLDGLFPDARLRRVFINFPDPWFKRAQHKRRLVTPELLEIIHKKLEPGGVLLFQSDVWDLALDALAVCEGATHLFTNTAGEWSFTRDNPFPAKSLREVRCEEKQWRIWRMLYTKR